MSHICDKCKKAFTASYRLEQHKKRKTPCTQRFICHKCNREFQAQRHLDRHLERLTTCVPDEIPVITAENTENRCQYCNKTYSTKSSLMRHMKTCDKEVNMAAIMHMLQKLDNKVDNNHKMSQSRENNPQIVNNNTYNNNLYVGNKLCLFGEEDFALLDQNKVAKLLLDDPHNFVPLLLREIHTNPDLPQNHNVYYDAKTDEAIVFTRVMINGVYVSTWQRKEVKEVSKQLVTKAKRYPTCMPLAQNIRPNSLEEQRYVQSMNIVTRQYEHSDKDVVDTKEMLSIVTKHPKFFNMVEGTTYVSGMGEVTLPLIHLN
jgi:hypothetical protein